MTEESTGPSSSAEPQRPTIPWWPAGVLGVAIVIGLLTSLHRPTSTSRLLLAAAELHHRRLPLWDNSTTFGEPFLAKGQLAVFSPTVLPLLLPPKWGWPLREVIRLALASFGAALIARRWGARDLNILVIAGTYVLCGAILGQMRDTAEEAWIWLSWCALSIQWLINRVTPARVAVAALAFAIVFVSGDPMCSAAVVITSLGFLAGHFRHRGAILIAPAAMFAIILGVAMTAMVWLPWWENRHLAAASPVKPPAQAWFVRNYKWLPTRDEARRAAAEAAFNPKAIVLLDHETSPDWKVAVDYLNANPPATKPSGGFFSRAQRRAHYRQIDGGGALADEPPRRGWLDRDWPVLQRGVGRQDSPRDPLRPNEPGYRHPSGRRWTDRNPDTRSGDRRVAPRLSSARLAARGNHQRRGRRGLPDLSRTFRRRSPSRVQTGKT